MTIDLNLVVFFIPFIALTIALIALAFSIVMQVRVKRIFRSAKMPDVEKLIGLHTKTLEDFVKFKVEATQYMKTLDNRIQKKTTNASTLKYNSFQGAGSGGNQSFSSVFANEKGDGVVITSLHTRERTNVFAKSLQNWQSENNLLEEEKQTIEAAKQKENELKQ
jgi:hypothetical protein